MATSHVTRQAKPSKPRPDFPLFSHGSGQWAKKIKGKLWYFGTWSDPDAALRRWLAQKDDLLAGRKPRPVTEDGLSVRDACNQFLTSKEAKLVAGDLSKRHFDDLHHACELIVKHFGKHRMVEDLRADDFRELRAKMAKRLGPSSLKREIANVRQIFRYAYQNDLIDRPVKFGSEFAPPSKKLLRQARNQTGERMFSPEQLREVIDSASVQLRAMVLLGLNAALGNTDITFLELKHLDLESGWLSYPRRKTGLPRRAKLWPETVAAVEAALGERPKHKQPRDADLVFITKYGGPWGSPETRNSPLAHEFRKVLDKLDMYRRGLSFYSLRHVFRTIADEVSDHPAVDLVMGHADASMAAVYRERIADERLETVSTHVHNWLYGGAR